MREMSGLTARNQMVMGRTNIVLFINCICYDMVVLLMLLAAFLFIIYRLPFSQTFY